MTERGLVHGHDVQYGMYSVGKYIYSRYPTLGPPMKTSTRAFIAKLSSHGVLLSHS